MDLEGEDVMNYLSVIILDEDANSTDTIDFQTAIRADIIVQRSRDQYRVIKHRTYPPDTMLSHTQMLDELSLTVIRFPK